MYSNLQDIFQNTIFSILFYLLLCFIFYTLIDKTLSRNKVFLQFIFLSIFYPLSPPLSFVYFVIYFFYFTKIEFSCFPLLQKYKLNCLSFHCQSQSLCSFSYYFCFSLSVKQKRKIKLSQIQKENKLFSTIRRIVFYKTFIFLLTFFFSLF